MEKNGEAGEMGEAGILRGVRILFYWFTDLCIYCFTYFCIY